MYLDGQKLRKIRTQKLMSRADLARLAGVSINSIARTEDGESEPTFSVAKKIILALGVEADDVVDWQRDLNRPTKGNRPRNGRGNGKGGKRTNIY